MKKINDAGLRFEINCRRLLLKKLEPIKKRFQSTVASENASHEDAKAQLLGTYESVEEAHEAFGYGEITEEQYRFIADGVEAPAVSLNSAALDLLNDFIVQLTRQIKDFVWEDLPLAERERIRQSNEQYIANLQAKKATIAKNLGTWPRM